MKPLAKSLPTIRCPRCKKGITVTEVLFLSNFTVVVNGTHCGTEITSGEINALELFPCRCADKKGNGHG